MVTNHMIKVLIVDDTVAIQDFITLYLTGNGYEVETADTKNEVDTRLKKFHPDVILLDVRLNGEDGREICKEIKSRTLDKPVYIVLISASREYLEHYVECSADGYIEKPFDMKHFLKIIEGHINPSKKSLLEKNNL